MTYERRIIGSKGDPGDAAPSVVPRAIVPTFAFPGMAPPAPTNLTLTPGFTDDDIYVDANWTPGPPSAAGAITSYAIEILVDGQTLPHIEHPPADGLPPYRIHNLIPNQVYHITIRAITGLGATSSSLSGDVTTGHSTAQPPKVTGLAGGVGFKTATLTWNQLGTTLNPFIGKYYVAVATDSGMGTLFHAPYDNGSSSVITITNLVTFTPYYFQVQAVSASGVSGPASDVFGPLTPGLAQGQFVPSDGIVPSFTTSAPGMTGGPGYLFVEWGTITNPDIVTYEVHLGTTSPFAVTSGSKVGEVVGGTTFFAKLDSGGNSLAYDVNYYARIYPKDKDGYTSAGPSPISAAAQLVRVGASDVATINSNQLKDGNPPASSPTTHIVGGVGFLHVWWSPVTNNDLVTYDVHLSTTTGFTPSPGTLVTSTTTTSVILKTLPGSNTALSYSTTYYVRIIARDMDGAAAVGTQGSAQVLQVGAPDIVANSLTSASGVFGTVDASIITTGTLAASHIGAGTVDATKLSVTIGGQNFGLNTGFERASDGQIPDSWILGSGSVSTTQGFFVDTTTKKYGTRSWRITAATTANYYAYQDIVLAPGRWTVSCWIKRSSVVSAQGSGLNIDGLDTTVTPVRNWLGTIDSDVITTGTNEFRQEWTIIDVSVAGSIRVYLQQGYGAVTTGTTWFDGLSVTQGDVVVAWSPPADEILPGTIVANMMTANSITAENAAIADAAIHNAKIADLDAGKIRTGTLDASIVTVSGLSAAQITTGTFGADVGFVGNLVADQIKTGTLNATGTVTIRHLDATEVTAGTLSFDRLQGGTLGAYLIVLTNGGVIRSENFSDVAGSPAGWQIDGAGNLTANFANLRNGLYTAGRIEGTDIIGGSFLISNKFYVADTSSEVQCIANIRIGFNYSGGVYATDASYHPDFNWGMSIDNPIGDGGAHTKLRYYGNGFAGERRAGVYDSGVGWAFFADQNTTCQARTVWGIFSSREIKTAIGDLPGCAVEQLAEIRPVEYRLNSDSETVQRRGFIAEEVLETSLSFLVQDLGEEGESRYSLRYDDLIPVLTKAVTELHDTDDTHETRLDALEARIAALEVH